MATARKTKPSVSCTLTNPEPKKHSVRYNEGDDSPSLTSVYIPKDMLYSIPGVEEGDVPEEVVVTLSLP